MISRRAAALVLAAFPTLASGQQADLSISFSTSGQVITQSTAPEVTLVISNAGPNVATGAVARTTRPFPLEQMIIQSPTNCVGMSGMAELTWTAGALHPGASASCVFSLRALPAAVAQGFFLAFRVSADQIDPNASNSQATREFVLSSFEITVDAAVTGVLTPSGPIANGATRRLVVSLRNNGPAAATFIKATSSPVPRGIVGGDPFILVPAPGSPCATFYEDLGLVTLVDVFPLGGLAGGTGVDCLLEVRTSPTVSSRTDVTFTASVAGIGVVDTNRSNDQSLVAIQVGVLPAAVPGPDSRAILLGALLLFATGIVAATRMRSTSPAARTPARG